MRQHPSHIRGWAAAQFLGTVGAVMLFSCVSAAAQGNADKGLKSGTTPPARGNYTFQNENLREAIDRVAQTLRLNVVYHVSSLGVVDGTDANLTLKDVSAPGTVDALLRTYDLTFDRIDRRAIMVFKKGTRGHGITVQTVISRAEADDADDRARGITLAEESLIDVVFKPMTLRPAILQLAQSVRLRLVFDPEMKSQLERTSVAVSLRDVTVGQALRYILDAYDLKYQEIDGITIKIVSEHDDHSSVPLEEIVKRMQ